MFLLPSQETMYSHIYRAREREDLSLETSMQAGPSIDPAITCYHEGLSFNPLTWSWTHFQPIDMVVDSWSWTQHQHFLKLIAMYLFY
jgi:hypothetical protein